MSSFKKQYSHIQSFEPTQLENLKKLGRDIKEDVVLELLTLHFEVASSTMSQMVKFYNANNLREVAFLAHQFKSNCGQLGLLKLQCALGELENIIRSNTAVPEQVSELMTLIREENEVCLSYLSPFKKAA